MIDRAINLVVLAGPTGVGKTDLSIELAKRFNGEVVSADSMQVYRNLDIGTGKIMPHDCLLYTSDAADDCCRV